MDLSKYTLKSQQAIQKAQEIAMANDHQAIENGHILKGILTVDENVTPFLLKKLNVNLDVFTQVLDKIVEGYSKVSGGNIYISQDASRSLAKAIS